jgi:hypothetical protein
MAASGLIGLAVTYYYDDPANEKLNTILKTGLQLVGLAMVALSTAAPEVSVGVAAALALSHVAGLPQCEFCVRKSMCCVLSIVRFAWRRNRKWREPDLNACKDFCCFRMVERTAGSRATFALGCTPSVHGASYAGTVFLGKA